MKITKGTIIRTILFFIVIINIFLEKKGIDLIPTDESVIATILEAGIEVAIMIVGFWKNNSYSKAAIKADKLLKDLKASSNETEWNYDDNYIEDEEEILESEVE